MARTDTNESITSMRDARVRKLVGIVERIVLGSAMSLALLLAEWRLGRSQRRR